MKIAKRQLRTSHIAFGIATLLVVIVCITMVFPYFGAWPRIQRIFPAGANSSAVAFVPVKLLVVRDVESRAPSAFFEASEAAISSDALYLRVAGIYGAFLSPIEIPASSISSCEEVERNGESAVSIATNLAGISVTVSDSPLNVRAWCEFSKAK